MRSPCLTIAAVLLAAAACTEPATPLGSLRITYSTAPGDELPFNWKLAVDGQAPRPINSASSGSLRIDSLAPGSHLLAISELPTVCTSGQDSRNIEIASGDTLSLSVQVTCTRVTGDVLLTVITTGPERDPDGYTLLVDGVPDGPVSSITTFSRQFTRLTPGKHTFGLTGLASNCSITSDSGSPTVVVGASVPAAIFVDCVATTATLHNTTTTTGGASLEDPSGYLVTVDTVAAGLLPANSQGSLTMTEGAHTVKISDIEPNCTAAVTQQAVTVTAGQTTDVSFSVACGAYAATVAALSAADPANDTLPNTLNSATPSFDYTAINTRYGPGFMVLTLHFNRDISAASFLGYIDFDLDEDAGTGEEPVMNFFGGTAPQGVESRLEFEFTATSGFADVATVKGTFGEVRWARAADSVTFIVPFDRFDGDDGNVTITAIIGPSDRPTDYLPNTGVLVSHVPAGAVASVRASGGTRPAAVAARNLLPAVTWRKEPR
jgi:hypothetical protein